MAFIVQCITVSGKKIIKKEKAVNNRCLTLKITAPTLKNIKKLIVLGKPSKVFAKNSLVYIEADFLPANLLKI